MTRRRVIALSLLLLLVGGGLADFAARSQPSEDNPALPVTAVVFTGQFDRIERGLALISAGKVERLFISGVNPKAGLVSDRFADRFALTSEQREWLGNGRIVLAPEARTTLENARETACWLQRHPEIRSVALITSQRHLARASLALERAIAPVRVFRVASDAADSPLRVWRNLSEARKFGVTWIVTLLPLDFWPGTDLAGCRTR